MIQCVRVIEILRPRMKAASFFATLICLSGCFNKKSEITDKPIVRVNEQSLSAKEFAEQLALRLRDFDAIRVKEERVLQQAKDQVINDFIIETLTRDWATKNKIYVTTEELESEVKSIRGQYPDDLAFRRSLSNQGTTFDYWQEKIKFSLLQKKVLSEIKKGMSPPTEAEIKSFYDTHKEEFQSQERVRLRQIVLDSESNAKRIYDEVRRGRSIKDLATSFSIAPEAEKGGDIGWIAKGTLDIFDAAFAMRVGQRSEVVKSPYGYHIFEVVDKRRATLETLKATEDRIKRRLVEKAEQQVYSAWLEEKLRSSRVFKDQELIRSLTVETKDE